MDVNYDYRGHWHVGETITNYNGTTTTSYTFRPSYSSMYNSIARTVEVSDSKTKPKRKVEDWSKSKEVDEFLGGFEVK